jgi:hypothetical protein
MRRPGGDQSALVLVREGAHHGRWRKAVRAVELLILGYEEHAREAAQSGHGEEAELADEVGRELEAVRDEMNAIERSYVARGGEAGVRESTELMRAEQVARALAEAIGTSGGSDREDV